MKSDTGRRVFYSAGVTANWGAHRNQKTYWCVARISPESGAIEYCRSASGVISQFRTLKAALRKAGSL